MEVCGACGKRGDSEAIRRCTGCRLIRYCSRDCQRHHWKCHKRECRKARDRTVTEESTVQEDQGTEQHAEAEAGLSSVDHASDGSQVTCKKCGIRRSDMKKCSHCLEAAYCSRDCQRADWKRHRLACQQMDVIKTEGFRQMEEEKGAQRAERERECITNRVLRESLSALLSDVHVTASLTWEQARTRAQSLYPQKRIVDRFSGLPSDFMFRPQTESLVALVRITGLYPHFVRQGRCLEDSDGKESFVLFYNAGDPEPYFSYHQLREGNYLCYERACMHFFLDGTVGFRVDRARDIHIMEA